MDAFRTHTGTALPLRRSNVDTDQIIPAVYLKRVTKTGFEDGLFAAWRNDPSFVLNLPQYAGASIIVPGPDFGTGSSREHAVWALQNYGFRVVIGSRFGDIFRGNSGKAGLLVARIDQKIVEELWDYIEEHPQAPITVDLEARAITAQGFETDFEIDDYTRWRLLEGLDDIGLTLRHADAITAYEASRPSFKPKTLPAKIESLG
jgi:3-isopropylmalate/(R)-2-methylmalate dehydratase small subunit